MAIDLFSECDLCGSIDLWETPAGALCCHTCGFVRRPDSEVEDDFLRPDWYRELTLTQRNELLQPVKQRFCLCCGRWRGHGPYCEELLAGWLTMPWGKHKGKPISSVSTDYLEFVLKRRFGDAETQRMMEEELAGRGRIVVLG